MKRSSILMLASIGLLTPLAAQAQVAGSTLVGVAGGFLCVAKHDVAIPVDALELAEGKFVLAGATKDALKAMAPFEYVR